MPQRLKTFALFENLSLPELTAISSALDYLEVNAGEFVFREGEPGDALYLLHEGAAEVLAGVALTRVNMVGGGEIFGEMAVIDAMPRSASIRAITKLELSRLASVEFFRLFQHSPQIAQVLLKRLTGRMRTITVQLQNQVEALASSQKEIVAGYDSTLALLSKALDLRDHATEGHSLRVTEYTCRLAWKLSYPEESMQALRMGALLHDVGKIGVPDAILRKPGMLTEEEMEVIRKHPEWGYEMLREIDFLSDALPVIRHHHEKFDGSGYPDGLRRDEIPWSARIFALIDAYDAMTSDRPYRKAMPHAAALAELRRCAGAHFDPDVVEAFIEL